MTQKTIENTGITIYAFEPGERALIKRGRYAVSHVTPLWCHCYACEIVRYNKNSVTVKVDGYEDERHYVDAKDLVPEKYKTGTLA